MSENGFAVFRTASLAEQVYDYLLRQISTGAYLPGAPLRELDLVAQTGVSRTPIREALLRLAESGLVEMNSRSAQVRRLSSDDVVQIYQVRQALEREAVRLACGRLTEADFVHLESLAPKEGSGASGPEFGAACQKFDLELHRLIAVRSGNTLLAREIRKFHDLVQVAHRPVANRAGRLDEELRQHREILAALKAGDRGAAQRALLVHLRSACAFLVRRLNARAPAPVADRNAPPSPAVAGDVA